MHMLELKLYPIGHVMMSIVPIIKTAGGIYLPKSAVKFERNLMGEILSVGEKVQEVERAWQEVDGIAPADSIMDYRLARHVLIDPKLDSLNIPILAKELQNLIVINSINEW
ncbi:hypothetical protein K1719_000843 [Acacia pycnantha]|nr:hypothetical protein K1719_000843 [Acacia pycnantha]